MATGPKTDDALDNVRDFAAKGSQQAKETYSRMQQSASEMSAFFEDAFVKSSKGYQDLGRKSVEISRTNVNAHFDFLTAFINAKSPSEAFEIQSNYMRKGFGDYAEQAKELSTLAQKALSDSSESVKDAVSKSVKTAA